MKLQFIRHGATASNGLKRYLGTTDEMLSEKGIAAIRQRKAEGKYPSADLVASSPMKRCLQTAELIYGSRAFIRIEEWKEIDFGSFECKNYIELQDNPDYQKWIDSQGKLPFPGGESREAFIERCTAGFRSFCRQIQNRNPQPEAVSMIVHGGTIMSILSSFSREEYYSFQCENGEGYSCELYPGEEISLGQIKRL